MGFCMGIQLEAGTGAKPVVGAICCIGRAIVYGSCSCCYTSDDVISSTIGHNDAMLTYDFSLAL